jgi:hypothetical protein
MQQGRGYWLQATAATFVHQQVLVTKQSVEEQVIVLLIKNEGCVGYNCVIICDLMSCLPDSHNILFMYINYYCLLFLSLRFSCLITNSQTTSKKCIPSNSSQTRSAFHALSLICTLSLWTCNRQWRCTLLTVIVLATHLWRLTLRQPA